MGNSDWSLMVFTLAMQFSVGVVLIYDLFLLFPIALKKEKLPLRFRLILMIALVAAFTGVAFSLLHLGNPGNAIKTLSNLKNSWLSREILFVLIYTVLLTIATGLQFKFPTSLGLYHIIHNILNSY